MCATITLYESSSVASHAALWSQRTQATVPAGRAPVVAGLPAALTRLVLAVCPACRAARTHAQLPHSFPSAARDAGTMRCAWLCAADVVAGPPTRGARRTAPPRGSLMCRD